MAKSKDEAPKNAPSDAAATLNKAQAEFQRYVKRMRDQQPGTAPVFMMPYPQGAAMPGWAVPPSVAMMSGYGPAGPSGQMAGSGSLTHRLGTTLRLGVDVLNATLAGGARLLHGVSDIGYGYAGTAYHHEGCDCGCCDCCQDDCCGCDCCDCCETCCHPGVGNCC